MEDLTITPVEGLFLQKVQLEQSVVPCISLHLVVHRITSILTSLYKFEAEVNYRILTVQLNVLLLLKEEGIQHSKFFFYDWNHHHTR